MIRYLFILLLFVCIAAFNFQSCAMEFDLDSSQNLQEIISLEENKIIQNSDAIKSKKLKKKSTKKKKKIKQIVETAQQDNLHNLPQVNLENLHETFNFDFSSILQNGTDLEKAQKLQWLANLLLIHQSTINSIIMLYMYLLDFEHLIKQRDLCNIEISDNYQEIIKNFENLNFDSIQCKDTELPAQLFFIIKIHHKRQQLAISELMPYLKSLLNLLSNPILELRNYSLYIILDMYWSQITLMYSRLNYAKKIFSRSYILTLIEKYYECCELNKNLIVIGLYDPNILQFCNQLPCALYMNKCGEQILDSIYDYISAFFKNYNLKKFMNIITLLPFLPIHKTDELNEMFYGNDYKQLYELTIKYLGNLQNTQSKKQKFAQYFKKFAFFDVDQLHLIGEQNFEQELKKIIAQERKVLPKAYDNDQTLINQWKKYFLKIVKTDKNLEKNFLDFEKKTANKNKKKKKIKSQKNSTQSSDIDEVEQAVENLTTEDKEEVTTDQYITQSSSSSFNIKITQDKKNKFLYHIKPIGKYDKRIIQWLDTEFIKNYNFKEIYYHTFPFLVDYYLFNIGLTKEQANKTHQNQTDIVHELFGEIKFKEGDRSLIVFHATKDFQGICYHRGYELLERNPFFKSYLHSRWWPVTLRDEFPALNQEMPSIAISTDKSAYVISEDELCIKIFDPKYEIHITLFKP